MPSPTTRLATCHRPARLARPGSPAPAGSRRKLRLEPYPFAKNPGIAHDAINLRRIVVERRRQREPESLHSSYLNNALPRKADAVIHGFPFPPLPRALCRCGITTKTPRHNRRRVARTDPIELRSAPHHRGRRRSPSRPKSWLLVDVWGPASSNRLQLAKLQTQHGPSEGVDKSTTHLLSRNHSPIASLDRHHRRVFSAGGGSNVVIGPILQFARRLNR